MGRKCFVWLLLTALLMTGCRKLPESEVTEPSASLCVSTTAPAAEETAVCATEPAAAETSATLPPTEPTETGPTVPATEPPTETEPVTASTEEPPEDTVFSVSLNEEGHPHLTWERASEAQQYKVYRSVGKKLSASLIISTNKTDFTDTNAPKGLTLYYHIEGLDSNGKVCFTSETVSAATQLPEAESLETRYVSIPKLWLFTLPHPDTPAIPLRYMDELLLGAEVAPSATGNWYRVFHYDKLYYLLIERGDLPLTPKKSTFRYTGSTRLQQQVIELSLDLCNNRKTAYLSGGSGWLNSEGAYEFSCSGLVSYILNTVMRTDVPVYNLPARIKNLYAVEEIYNVGYPGELRAKDIAMEDLQPGDILFFTSQSDGTASKEIGHCGLYLGNGEFVHSTSAWKDSVCIMPLAGVFLENLRDIRRYLPEDPEPALTPVTIDSDYRYYKVYARQSSDSAVLSTPAQGDTLTLLFTNGTWAYVETADGKTGYFPARHFE